MEAHFPIDLYLPCEQNHHAPKTIHKSAHCRKSWYCHEGVGQQQQAQQQQQQKKQGWFLCEAVFTEKIFLLLLLLLFKSRFFYFCL